MDIKKLIEQLNRYFEGKELKRGAALDAATALSALQAENEKLRAELKSKVDLVFQQAKELDRRHLLLQEQEAELDQVKRAARNDIPHNCHTCIDRSDPMCPGNKLKNSFNFQENCNKWTWRGPQKED